MNSRTYESPGDFKQALEARLRKKSGTGLDFTRRRQMLVLDRFLARVVEVMGEAVIVKGGLVLELRLERARTTRDIDLRVEGDATSILEKLRKAGQLDLGDFLSFEVREGVEHAEILDEVGQPKGVRYRTEARLAGKLYGEPFGVDVGFDDALIGEPDIVTAEDLLGFAGIAPPKLRLYPVESHIAEKLHAYTLPRERQNSRVKDLPDLALLGTIRQIEARALRRAIDATFSFRKSHDLLSSIPDPPIEWAEVYQRMARQDELEWRTLDDLMNRVRAFLGPVVGGEDVDRWSPEEWRWHGALSEAR